MLKTSEVFDKQGSNDSLTASGFYALLSMFVIYGLGGSAVVANHMMQTDFVPQLWHILVLGLGVPILGIFVAQSDNWVVSFIGYNMVLLPFGVILGPVLKPYDPDIIRNVAGLTAAITVAMGLAGVMLPQLFSKLGTALFVSLLALVVVRVVGIFVPAIGQLGIIDYLAAGLFSLYIGYDMYRASVVERTIDNAVDIALSLYLDIINLFLNLLSIADNDD